MGSRKALASAAERALQYVERGPRVDLKTPRENPGAKTKGNQVVASHNKAGQGHKMAERAAAPPLGYIFGDWFTPWQRRFPGDPHLNRDVHLKREYPPLSLLELQRLIDTGYLDPALPIDLAALANTRQYAFDPLKRQFGVQLTAEGSDVFSAAVALEVQAADEEAIAAVERNGGRVVCAYFDPVSLLALANPPKALRSGEPIPRRGFPPPDIIQRYIGELIPGFTCPESIVNPDPRRRGYLADPAAVAAARVELGQRFGFDAPEPLPHVAAQPLKDPLQVFGVCHPVLCSTSFERYLSAVVVTKCLVGGLLWAATGLGCFAPGQGHYEALGS